MYKKILVPMDGSELAECVLPHVETIVKGCGVASVVFIRAVTEGVAGRRGPTFFTENEWKQIEARSEAGAQEYLKGLTGKLHWGAVPVQGEVALGDAAATIADYADKNGIDLIVMATHGRSGLSRIAWGSVADRVLRSVKVPVLMVRPEGTGPSI